MDADHDPVLDALDQLDPVLQVFPLTIRIDVGTSAVINASQEGLAAAKVGYISELQRDRL